MKIIIISTPTFFENEEKIITELFENGLETFHLRKPKCSTKEMKQFLRKIPAQFHNRIVIHSHHRLITKFNLKGIHYTKYHLISNFKNWWTEKLISFYRNELTRSTSHTKLASLYDAPQMNYDYVFLSPIFDSLTGKYQSGFYEEGIRAAIQKSSLKIIARGGVDESRVKKIKELGFYGLALYSYIWDSKTPVERFIRMVQKCNKLHIEIE